MDLMAVAQLLGNFGEFVGSIAVVVTLAYLTVQVRQSKQASVDAILLARAEAGMNMGLRLTESENLPSLYAKARAVDGVIPLEEQEFISRYHMTEEEAVRYTNHWFSQARLMEIRFIRLGSMDISGERAKLRILARSRSFQIWWPVNRVRFDEPFRSEVDSALATTTD